MIHFAKRLSLPSQFFLFTGISLLMALVPFFLFQSWSTLEELGGQYKNECSQMRQENITRIDEFFKRQRDFFINNNTVQLQKTFPKNELLGYGLLREKRDALVFLNHNATRLSQTLYPIPKSQLLATLQRLSFVKESVIYDKPFLFFAETEHLPLVNIFTYKPEGLFVAQYHVHLFEGLINHSSSCLVQISSSMGKVVWSNYFYSQKKWYESYLDIYSSKDFLLGELVALHEVNLKPLMKLSFNKLWDLFLWLGISLSFLLILCFLFSQNIVDTVAVFSETIQSYLRGRFNVKPRLYTENEFEELEMGISDLGDILQESVSPESFKKHGKYLNKRKITQVREVITLYCQVRGWSSLLKVNSIQSSRELLNRYLTMVCEKVEKSDGTILNIFGDQLQAVWGIDKKLEETSYGEVIMCALEIRKRINTLNQNLIKKGEAPIYISMGIHVGPVMTGMIGAKSKLKVSAYGLAMELGPLLGLEAAKHNVDLLVSEAVAHKASEFFILNFLGDLKVDKSLPNIKLYDVQGYIDSQSHEVTIKTPYSHL